MDAIKHDGIFRSAHEAVVFALNYSGQQYAMSPFARLMQDGALGSGRGLAGLDGAGQAGMVIAELAKLDYYLAVALIARCATRQIKCDCHSACCSGWRINELWRQAISIMTDHAMTALAGELSSRVVRQASVQKHFGQKVTIQEIADDAGIHRETAGKQHAQIVAAMKALESRAWQSFSEALEAAGMLMREETTETA